MKKSLILLFVVLSIGWCLQGCICISQVSQKVLETDRVYWAVEIPQAHEAYRLEDDAVFKCQIFPYKKSYNFARAFGMCFEVGGAQLEPLNAAAYDYVYLRCENLFESKEERICVSQGRKKISICSDTEAEPFLKGEALPIPLPEALYKNNSDLKLVTWCVDMNESESHWVWESLAWVVGVTVDVPLSLVMTGTGTIWYLPFIDHSPFASRGEALVGTLDSKRQPQ